MGTHPRPAAQSIVSAALVLLLAGCASTLDRAEPLAPSTAADRCRQPDTTSGRVVVGSPSPTPGLVEVPPDSVMPPPPQLPTLAAIEAVPVATAADEIRYSFDGDGVVAWSARFVQSPTLRGTDAAVPIVGSCILQIDLSGTAPDDLSAARGQPVRIATTTATQVVDIARYRSDEQIAQSFVGTRSRAPRVSIVGATAALVVRISSA